MGVHENQQVVSHQKQRQQILTAGTQTININLILGPALSHSLHLFQITQQLLSTTTLFLLLRTWFISQLLLQQSLYATQILAVQTFYASRLALCTGLKGLRRAWRGLEPLRNKFFFEFMVFILGGGNPVILLVFWPGWLVIWGVVGAWWAMG